MPTVPRVHEIFSNKALDKAADFRYKDQEVREQLHLNASRADSGAGKSHRKGPAPQPPDGMKRFGAYKPKILAGEEGFIVTQSENGSSSNDSNKENVHRSSFSFLRPDNSARQPKGLAPKLTKPKPWVVGDKDVPMVLGGKPREEDATADTPVSACVTSTTKSVVNSNGVNSKEKLTEHVELSSPNDANDKAVPVAGAAFSGSNWSVTETSVLVHTTNSSPSIDQLGVENPAFGSFNPLPLSNSGGEETQMVVRDSYDHAALLQNNKKDTVGPTLFSIAVYGPQMEDGLVNKSYAHPVEDLKGPTIKNPDVHVYDELLQDPTNSGVYIPEPDYDEDEQTLDFNSEDDTSGDEAKARAMSSAEGAMGRGGEEAKTGMALRQQVDLHDRRRGVHSSSFSAYARHYDGADLSHYLSDDEADVSPLPPMEPEPTYPTTSGKPKARKYISKKGKAETLPIRPKIPSKHLLFKDPPLITSQQKSGSASGKKNGKSGSAYSAGFNSVRNFSFADSKFGTKGRAVGGRLSLPPTRLDYTDGPQGVDDSDLFLNATAQSGPYESFLCYRHGQPAPESSDSGVEIDDLAGVSDPSVGGRRGAGVWNKLTWRLRNRNSKGYKLADP